MRSITGVIAGYGGRNPKHKQLLTAWLWQGIFKYSIFGAASSMLQCTIIFYSSRPRGRCPEKHVCR